MVRNEERVLHAPPELDLRLELHLQRFFTDVVFVDHDVVAEPQTEHLEDDEKRVDLFETKLRRVRRKKMRRCLCVTFSALIRRSLLRP